MNKISVVVNTLNEGKRIDKCLASVFGFANEIIVVDMMSTDETVEIAKRYKAKIYKHKRLNYVEPVRNFGIEKATSDWVLILDADERIPETLKDYLKKEIKKTKLNYFRIPRKNIIFGKWIKHTGWWPDYNIRFFKKGTVSWNEIIHSVPTTTGSGTDLAADGDYSIIHNSYSSLDEYLVRMNRYTTIASKLLNKNGVKFSWPLLIQKPLSEFLRRYFAEKGYEDGLHGLSLSLLQSFSELVTYLKLWQKTKFIPKKILQDRLFTEFNKSWNQIRWWVYNTQQQQEKSFIRRIWLKLKKRFAL